MTTQTTSPRQRILDKAGHLFFHQGYLATGVNQLIKEADVCKATFYAQFPSKEDLCLEYIKTSHERWMKLLQQKIDQHSDAYSRLIAVFDFLEEWMNSCNYRGCGLMNISGEIPQTKGHIRQLIRQRNDILKSAIHSLVLNLKNSDKKFSRIKVEEVTGLLTMIVQGAVVSSQAYADTAYVRQAKKAFEKLLISFK